VLSEASASYAKLAKIMGCFVIIAKCSIALVKERLTHVASARSGFANYALRKRESAAITNVHTVRVGIENAAKAMAGAIVIIDQAATAIAGVKVHLNTRDVPNVMIINARNI
jgi:hypothetical protein